MGQWPFIANTVLAFFLLLFLTEGVKCLFVCDHLLVAKNKIHYFSIYVFLIQDKQLTSLVSKLDELKENNQQLQLEVSGCKRYG